MRHPHTVTQPLITRIVAHDLCIACGACVSACPYSNLRPVFSDRRGAEEVELVAAERCAGCAQPCDRVCPSIEVDFLQNREALGREGRLPGERPARDGWLKSIHVGWSPHFKDDGVSSSGGVIRALISHALDNATPVVCLARAPDAGGFAPRLLTRPEQLEEVPGSIYHSTSFVGAIDRIREAPSPVLLVAIPCQLAGILNYIAKEERELGKRIQLVCGIVCGWMYSFHSLHAFSTYKGIPPVNLGMTTYRGEDRIGKLKLGRGDSRIGFARRNFATLREAMDYRSSFSTDYNRLRCRLCEDHLNLGADVVAGDAWLPRCDKQKASLIGCRTERGQDAIVALEEAGLLKLEAGTFADFVESQSRNLVFGAAARTTNKVLRAKGVVTPSFRFSDGDEQVGVGLGAALSVNTEMIRRRVVRAGHYRLYWWYYVLRRWRMTVSSLWKMLRRRIHR
jgi:coenzyme F420 hydrogenase subunit beta